MKKDAACIDVGHRRPRAWARAAVLAGVVGSICGQGALGATFPADGPSLGAIPDAAATGPGAPGAPRNVTFTVSGLTGNVSSVNVDFNAVHTWVGDLEVTL